MTAAGELIAYPPSPDAIWWISDSKSRSEMAPDELAQVRRRAQKNYLRMRERMSADPAYREARLEVGRRVKRNSRARNRDKPKSPHNPARRVKPRSEMTPEQLARRHRRDRETYQRMRERMATDPEYREARLNVARRSSKKWHARNRDNPEMIAKRRTLDRARWAELGPEQNARNRRTYVGERAKQIREANRAWYAANRDTVKARRKAYREANREAVRARDRERQRREYAEDPKKFNEYMKAWRAQNPEKARLSVRVSGIKRRAAAAGMHFKTKEWLALLEMYEGRCGYCGIEGPLEADHRTPLCRGGSNTIENIIPACRHCNRSKHRRTESEFRDLLAREAAMREAIEPAKESRPDPDGSATAQ